MPTLVITGHPSAGKTKFARILAERALIHSSQTITSTVVINEESSCPGRSKSECYTTSRAEKVTREALKSDFDRNCTSISKNSEKNPQGKKQQKLVILDSLNYIKGFRYEIHCIAKASGERHGIVWVLNDPNVCMEWNRKRREAEQIASSATCASSEAKSGAVAEKAVEDWYRDDDMVEELMRRYEPPDERNRWDKPLFRADVGSVVRKQQESAKNSSSSSGNNNKNVNNDIEKRADEEDTTNQKDKSSTDAVLSRTLYDMHSLTEAIGAENTENDSSSDEKLSKTTKKGAKSFKRSAASGFKRNPSRVAKPVAREGGANAEVGIKLGSGLTLEALESLNQVNSDSAASCGGDGGGFHLPTATSSLNAPSEEKKNNLNIPQSVEEHQPDTLEELADSILDAFLAKDVGRLKEGKSTAVLVNAGSNLLHNVDVTTQQVVANFAAEQRSAMALGSGLNSGRLRVPIGSDKKVVVEVRINRSVTLSELKRIQRGYVKWMSSHPPEDTSDIGIATSFLSYIESQM